MSEHLDFDTDFLNEAKTKNGKGKPVLGDAKLPKPSKWRKNIMVTAVVIFGVWILVASSDNSGAPTAQYTPPPSTNSYNSPSSNDSVVTGTYRCSQYNHNRAGELEPTASDQASLKADESYLNTRSNSLDSEKSQLENEYVDESDQDSIDTHNAKVDAFNVRLQQWRNKAKANSGAIDAYNVKVQTYNNFLTSNCTPI